MEYNNPLNKWCVKITSRNKDILSEFLIKNKKHYSGWNKTWCLYERRNYFHFPGISGGMAHSSSRAGKKHKIISEEESLSILNGGPVYEIY